MLILLINLQVKRTDSESIEISGRDRRARQLLEQNFPRIANFQ